MINIAIYTVNLQSYVPLPRLLNDSFTPEIYRRHIIALMHEHCLLSWFPLKSEQVGKPRTLLDYLMFRRNAGISFSNFKIILKFNQNKLMKTLK